MIKEVLAPAKINWYLDVLGRRPDGYHNLRMVMQQVSLYDRICLYTAPVDGIVAAIADMPRGADNLALRAWLALKAACGLDFCLQIEIEKEIPLAAGLAGGSSDAAAVLLAANEAFSLGLSPAQLAEIGLQLGADVPFCLLGGAAIAEGIGERLQALDSLPRYHLVLANPGFALSTATVFQQYDEGPKDEKIEFDFPGLVAALQNGDISTLGGRMANRLQPLVQKKYPQVARLAADMFAQGLYPLMSGSGPSVLGLAGGAEHALAAAVALSEQWSFVRPVHTLSSK